MAQVTHPPGQVCVGPDTDYSPQGSHHGLQQSAGQMAVGHHTLYCLQAEEALLRQHGGIEVPHGAPDREGQGAV